MSGSYYALNAKYNSLLSKVATGGGGGLTAVLTANDDAGGLDITNLNNINLTTINGLPPAGAENLQQTLTIGNSAGTNDINMNSQDILAVNNIALATINGAAYPPVVADNTLTEVLTAGNAAGGLSITGVNDIALTTINGAAYPPVVADNTLTEVLTAGNDAGGLDITNLNQLSLSGTSTITDSTGDLVIQPPTNQTIQLGNNIYVDTLNNRVGINVPVPTEDLEIDGNIQMDTGGTSKIVFYDKPNAHEHGEIDAEGEGTNGGALKFQTKVDGGAVSEKLRITENGRLGLGGANYGTTGQVLTSNGATAPTWETLPAADPSVVETDTDATYYPVFVDGAGSGITLRADTTTTPISVNPNTGDFNVGSTLKLTQSELAVGKNAGAATQGDFSTAIGYGTGSNTQGSYSTAIGFNSGNNLQGGSCVAIGSRAGESRQVGAGVAIGFWSARRDQGSKAVAIGYQAGYENQNAEAIAIGNWAGNDDQGVGQGTRAIAIGTEAGKNNQGATSVAIGCFAGRNNQGANSIILNATGSQLNNTGTSRFTVKPVRNFGTESGFVQLYYNPSTGEIAYT
jgi:hypothetical protein